MPLARDVNLDVLAERTVGFTGADSEGLVRRAGLYAFRDAIDVEVVHMSCFDAALAESHPSVSDDVEREYEAIVSELKRESPTGRRRIGFSVASQTPGADATSG